MKKYIIIAVALVLSIPFISSANLMGDANGDHVVDNADFLILQAAFGSIPGSPTWDERADFNGDGYVNAIDFNILASNFGATESIPVISAPVIDLTGTPSSGGGTGMSCMMYWPGTSDFTPCFVDTMSILQSIFGWK